MANTEYLKRICEACYLAIQTEELRHWEEEIAPLTNLQKEIIRQRYRDKAIEIFKELPWESVSNQFDNLYIETEHSHETDYLAEI